MSKLNTLSALASLTLTGAAAAAPLKIDTYTGSAAGFHATSTLIQGEKDAVLVDAQFTMSDAYRVTAMVLESGKTLKTIFVTHAHPDHFFGLEVLLRQFPDAQVVATPKVVEEAKVLAPQKMAYWKPLYGANLTNAPVIPTALSGDTLTLEGQTLKVVELAAGESEASAALYVPSAKTLIAGDLAFNNVHLWLAEGRPDQWIQNLERIQTQLPLERVIAGHKAPGSADSKDLLKTNVAYIKAFEKALKAGGTADDVKARVAKAYPAYQLPIILDIAAKALTPATK